MFKKILKKLPENFSKKVAKIICEFSSKFLSLLIIFLLLSGCLFSKKINLNGKGNVRLKQVEFSDFDLWEKDDHKKALQAFLHSCRKFSKMAPDRLIGGQISEIVAEDFHDVCDIAEVVKTMSSKQAKNFFENWFRPFLVETRSGNSSGTFTGYYEASLNGSTKQSEKFKFPVYAKPKDLTNEPYLSRSAIEAGALKHKNLELLYVDDKVDLFFMHIQGSGRVKLQDGREAHLSYAGRNNQPFIAIANYMADKKFLRRDNLNSATVYNWLKQHPQEADEVMNFNPAYTFFKISNNEYVVGAQGVPLTTERSLAVDGEIIPYGIPLWIETKLKRKTFGEENYQRLMIAQDTGSAIKGTVRGDIFFGYGQEAQDKAFYMAAQGKYFVLLPINIVDKIMGR